MIDESKWNVVGHGEILSFFDTAIKNGNVNHGYVFEGQDSVGKNTVAIQLFANLLGVPVNQVLSHPDLIVVERGVDPKTKKQREGILIEQIQEARLRFVHSTLSAGWKLMLIKEAHLLTESACNALLKTLEEPNGSACIVMTTHHASSLIPTIRSRVQVISFKPVPREDICDAIKPIVGSRDEAHAIAGYSAGRPGVAFNIVNNTELNDSLQEDKKKARICLVGKTSERILQAKNLLPQYSDDHVLTRNRLLQRVDMLQTIARDDLLYSIGCNELVTDRDSVPQLSRVQAVASLRGANTLKKQLAMHINPKIALINLMINIG